VLAMTLLFGAPSVLLASVTPIAVRLSAPALAVLGRRAGLLFSISTVGSIAGTFLTAFWLVPAVGVDQLLGLMAGALLAAAAVVSLAERVWLALVVALAATGAAVVGSYAVAPKVGAVVTGAAARNWSPVFRLRGAPAGTERASYDGTVVFRKDTQYHRLAVVDAYDGTRQLRFDSSYQSAERPDAPYAAVYPYTDYFQLGLAYDPAARRVLMIGLGGGSTVKSLLHDDPALDVDVAELDPVVREVARRYFSLPPDGPRLHTTIEDGRRFLTGTKRKWDVIMIDAYYSDSIPFHLVTLEFLELVRSHLAQDGVVVANVVGNERGKGSEFFRSIFRTYRSAFPSVVVHPVLKYDGDRGDGLRNLMVVASRTAAPSKRVLLERWTRHRSRFPAAPDLELAIDGRRAGSVSSAGVPVLTDDYAPTDALIVGNF
jgi:spermidine synthase